MNADNYILKHARFIGMDFVGGMDPTGSLTISYGAKDKRSNKGGAGPSAAAIAGGIVGGATIVPAFVSAASYGLAKSRGGVKAMLSASAYGAAHPFRMLKHTRRIGAALKRSSKTGRISPGHGVAKSIEYIANNKNIDTRSGVARSVIDGLRKGKSFKINAGQRRAASSLSSTILGESNNYLAGIATSAGLGGVSAGLQYRKGRALTAGNIQKKGGHSPRMSIRND